MIFSRHQNNAPTTNESTAKESLAKHIGTTLVIAAFAFVLAALFHGASGSDRSGYGMVVMGMSVFAAPVLAVSGGLSFAFRRTVIGDLFSGVCLFGAVFFATLVISN